MRRTRPPQRCSVRWTGPVCAGACCGGPRISVGRAATSTCSWRPATSMRWRRAIAPLGFARLPAWGFASHRFYLGYDASTDVWLKLDVVTELAFGPCFALRTDAAGACLRRRRRDGVMVLEDADAFWCLVLHRLLDKADVGPAAAALRRLASAPGCATSPLALEVERIVADRSLCARLLDAAQRGAWDELAAHGATLEVAWTRSRRRAIRRRCAAARLARRASPLVRSRRGMSVALVGPDGAGKSSAAAALARTFPFPSRTVYMSPAPIAPSPGVAARRRPDPVRRSAARPMGSRARIPPAGEARAVRPLRARCARAGTLAAGPTGAHAASDAGPRLPASAAHGRARRSRRRVAHAGGRARSGAPRDRAAGLPTAGTATPDCDRHRRRARARPRAARPHGCDLGGLPQTVGTVLMPAA